MIKKDFIKFIPLAPYSHNEHILVVSGYGAGEVKDAIDDFFKETYNMDSLKQIKEVLNYKEPFNKLFKYLGGRKDERPTRIHR